MLTVQELIYSDSAPNFPIFPEFLTLVSLELRRVPEGLPGFNSSPLRSLSLQDSGKSEKVQGLAFPLGEEELVCSLRREELGKGILGEGVSVSHRKSS